MCPRCNGQMMIKYDERKCVNCGWYDNSYQPEREQERVSRMRSLDAYISTNKAPGRPRKKDRENSLNGAVISLHRRGYSFEHICERMKLSPMRVSSVIKMSEEKVS